MNWEENWRRPDLTEYCSSIVEVVVVIVIVVFKYVMQVEERRSSGD